MKMFKRFATCAMALALSLTAAFATAADKKLDAPVINDVKINDYNFTLKWEPVENAKSYKVWYLEDGIGMELWRSTSKASYTHYGALKGKNYKVWVVAQPKSGYEASDASEAVVVPFWVEPTEEPKDEPTVDEPTVEEPKEEPKEDKLPALKLKTKQNKSGYFEIKWEAVEGATMYKVWYQEPGIGMDLWRSTTGTTYKHYGALSKKYTVWVVAMKGGEEISQPSAKVVVDFTAGKQDKAIDISDLNEEVADDNKENADDNNENADDNKENADDNNENADDNKENADDNKENVDEEDALPVLKLKTKQNKSGYFEIKWEAVEGATMYKVWYQEPGIGMDLWRSTTGTTYKHYGALAKKYTVWVVAMKGGKEISQPSAKVVVDFTAGKQAKAEDISDLNEEVADEPTTDEPTTDEPTVDEPTVEEPKEEPKEDKLPALKLKTKQNKSGYFEIKWEAVEGATMYKVWYQEPGIGMDLWRSTTGTTYKHYGALAKKYTVWVVAMKGGEEISQPSAKVVVDFAAGKQAKAEDISYLNEEVADEPTTDEPTTDEPTVDEPTTDEPTVEEPKEEPKEDKLPALKLKTKQNKSGYFEITWEAVEGASMYKVWYQEPGIGMDLWRSTTGTTYKHYGALAKKYTVWVVAMKGGEEVSQPSAKVVVDFAAGKQAKAEDISYLNATEEPAWAIKSASVNEEGMLTLDIDAVEGAAYYEIGCAAGHAEELEPVIVGGFDAVDAIDTTVDCWVCETIATSIYVVAYDENGVELDRTEAFAL